jgi:NADH:ubiquinone oxidoreductase subunit 2 (subunit N)
MKKIGYIVSALALPFLALAQGGSGTAVNSVQGAGQFLIDLINNVFVPVVFALAFFVFIWGIFQYFIQGGHDEEKRESGKSLMLWGLIGFFVMVSVWGLVQILVGTVGLSNTAPVPDIAAPVKVQ